LRLNSNNCTAIEYNEVYEILKTSPTLRANWFININLLKNLEIPNFKED